MWLPRLTWLWHPLLGCTGLPCHFFWTTGRGTTTPLITLCAVLVTAVLCGLITWRLRLRAAKRAAKHESGATERSSRRSMWARRIQSIVRRLKIKLKVFWSFYQIATKVGETYMVTYPPSVERSLEIFSFVNLVTPRNQPPPPRACHIHSDIAFLPTLLRSWTGSGCHSRARGWAALRISWSS